MAPGLLQGIEDYRWDMPKLQIIGSTFIYISSVLNYTGDTLDTCVSHLYQYITQGKRCLWLGKDPTMKVFVAAETLEEMNQD